jgi:hypothetical protein
MKKDLFISLYAGLPMSLAIIGGVMLGSEPSIMAKVVGCLLLVFMPIFSILVIRSSWSWTT